MAIAQHIAGVVDLARRADSAQRPANTEQDIRHAA
jgi:hypothetical protein